jgi:TRAP-type C4-dicarboxylate transport system substrate-binding protein
MIRALGARPTGTLQRLTGLENGDIQGFLFGLSGYQINHYEHAAPYVTANVNLGVGTATLVANPDRLSRLSSEQRGWLQRAANDAAARSTDMVNQDQQLAAEVCKAGARFANASRADLAALRRAFASVYSALEQNQQTKGFIARIKALKTSIPPGPPLAIPAGCSGSPSSQRSQ